MRVIGITNLKGGSGKTTVALCLAVGLARQLAKGRRLLIVDADPQGNASLTMLEGAVPSDPTLTAVLLDETEAAEAVRPSRLAGIDLIPADGSLAECTLLLADQLGRELRLKTALQSIQDRYDICIIDAPPQMSLISINVLNAASELIVPVDPGIYSASGLGKLQDTVEQVRKHLAHPELAIIGLILTKLTQTKAARDFERQLREHYGPLVYAATIPYAVRFEEACARHRTVLELSASPASEAFERLVKELTKHGTRTRHAGRNAGKNSRHGRTKRRAG